MNLRHILRARKFRSRWNPAEIDWIMANVQPGANVFDVGCHKGDWTYWLHKAVGKTGHIYAFEPQPTLNAYLTNLFTPSAWENVTLENIALTNADSVTKIFVPGELGSTSSGASLIETTLDYESEVHATEIATTSLDNYVAKHSIGPVEFLKIDAKGSEINILEGAENLRKNHDPSWIIESETRQIGEAGVEKLFTIMEADGYKGFFFPGGKKTPLAEFSFAKYQRRDFPRFWEHPQYCNNFLFNRKG